MRGFVHLVLMVWLGFFLTACGGGGDDGTGTGTDPYANDGEQPLSVVPDAVSTLEWTSPRVSVTTMEITPDEYERWVQASEHTKIEAIQYCADLTLDGKSDWRLPNANESGDALSRGLFDQFFTSDSFHMPMTAAEASAPITAIDVLIVSASFHMDEKPVNDPDGISLHEATFAIDKLNQYQGLGYGSTHSSDVSFSAGVICVRGNHVEQPPLATVGLWSDVVLHGGNYGRPVTLTINENSYSGALSNVFDNELTFTGWVTNYTCGNIGDCPEFLKLENATMVRSGITNVKLKGEFKAFVNNVPLAKAKMNSTTSARDGVAGVGDIGVVVGGAADYLFTPATAENPAGTTELATDGSGKLIVYCAVGADGQLILDNFSPVTTPTGSTDVTVTDYVGNEASFTVEVVGLDTDVGVLNVPEAAIPYNFKSTIDHGADYIYYGYNDLETPLSYSKQLSICNIGTENISGTVFTIEPDAADASLVRDFTHNYAGSATGFGAGECKTYTLNMAFNRPLVDDDVKINITITDSFNGITWDDYTTFKLSAYQPLPLYFAADSNVTFYGTGLQGLLVAPGRQLLRVNFASFSTNNFVRVPRKLDDEYQVILATTNINDESSYMISTDQVPNIDLMIGFTDVTINEPDNTYADATVVPLLNGEAIGYLHQGDVDFYRLTETLP